MRSFIPLVLLSLAVGCSKDSIEPVSVEQATTSAKSAFQGAAGEIKEAAGGVTSALERSDYIGAAGQIEVLSRRPDLDREQREALAAAQVAAMKKLQEAAAGGDKQANEFLEAHRAGK